MELRPGWPPSRQSEIVVLSIAPSSQSTVDALVAAGIIPADRRKEALRIAAEVTAQAAPRVVTPPPRRAGAMSDLAGYLGGILVIAAAAVFLATQWGRMSDATRVGALVVCGIILAASGLGVLSSSRASIREDGHDIRRYLASLLLVGGAAVLGGAAGVWAQEFTTLHEPHPQSIGFGLVAALAAASYLLVPSAVAQLAVAFPLTMTIATLVFDMTPQDHDPYVFGALLLSVGVIWGVLAERGAFRESTVARIISAVFAVVGAQNAVFVGEGSAVGYVALAIVGVVGFWMYLRLGAWPHLAMGVAGLTLAATEAAVDWSNGALGASGALLLAGTILLVLSQVGMRLRRGGTGPPHGMRELSRPMRGVSSP